MDTTKSEQIKTEWALCESCAKKRYVYFGMGQIGVCSDCGKKGYVVIVKQYFDFIEKHNRDLE